MKSQIEQRRNELCIGLVNLYAQEKEIQNQLAIVQAKIKDNYTAISEMEFLLDKTE